MSNSVQPALTAQPSLSESVRKEIDHWIAKFPTGRQKSAVIAALHAVQHENHGYIKQENVEAIAAYLDIEAIEVWEAANFYSIFETEKVGSNCVAVCTNIACWLRGGEDIVAHLEKKLEIKIGQSTADGRIFLKKEEECLAACNNAPMMMVNHVYHENLTLEDVDKIIDELK